MWTRREYLQLTLAAGAARGRLPDAAMRRRMIAHIEALPG